MPGPRGAQKTATLPLRISMIILVADDLDKFVVKLSSKIK